LRENVVMTSINEELQILRARGHKVEANPGACVVNAAIHVPIDDELRSASAIHEMVTPVDKDVFGFEARGKQYELHIYYLYGGAAYEMYQDGMKLGEAQRLNENELDFAQRTAESMRGSSLRRL
jgi:hypothetical protein